MELRPLKERPLLIEPTEEPKLKDTTIESEEKDMKEKPQSTACTFHAPPQILDIDGFIKHQPITIFADTRSSNDLMNDKRKHVTLCGKGENEEKMILTQCLEKLAEISGTSTELSRHLPTRLHDPRMFLMQCSLISGYFHDFTEERTMMLKVFPDDNLGSTTHDHKKEQEKGIHVTPTAMMSSISMLALPERNNVFVLRVDTSIVGIDTTLMQDGRLLIYIEASPTLYEKDTPQLVTCMVPTLVDHTNLQKLKIEGFLEQQSVIILIDAGSTHNFMSSDFHDFPQDRSMMLKDFLDDDLQSTAQDREKIEPL
ncbi:hypothetical protein B296_00005385 [Ensete ventricosum]|uniref:Uncharacterized protein n=1 Tax=Ensete ventricosum TaxID=4639 RepID=A0A426ZFM5_ENSVE|nr:hypothetical protein B296_00005385 [Ensete ventricosum]